jgi:transcriptional regulator GlxA family with amidase domain
VSFHKSYSFFLVDGFDLHAVAACIEALHCANRITGRKHYSWRIVGERGSPVVSGSGIIVPISGIAVERVRFDSIVVCADGTAAVNFHRSEIFAWLRRAEKFGADVGGVDCGGWILAQAGLLDDRRAAIAGDHAAGFRETFDRVLLTGESYVIDGNRFTSAGGLAGLDMFIRRVGDDLGDELAAAVSVQMNRVVESGAKSSGPRPLSERLGITHEKLAQCIALMEENVETPISSRELAEQTDLSVRHLERLFVNHFKQTLSLVLPFLPAVSPDLRHVADADAPTEQELAVQRYRPQHPLTTVTGSTRFGGRRRRRDRRGRGAA